MPLVKGLEVSVQAGNETLPEYGTMRLGSGSIFSTFIQSEDKTPFQINFRPSSSFSFSKPLEPKRDQHRKLTMWRPQEPRNWDLSAHIFIDDNLKADKNLIIDLPRHGESCEVVKARGRSCIDSNGNSAEQEWVFNEVPVEDQLAKLTTDDKMEDEWKTVSDPSTKNDTKDHTKMGQIKIKLFRIRQRGIDKTRKPERRSETPQGQLLNNIDNEISHTVGVGKPKPKTFRYITVDYLDGPNAPWATVIFMYRGKSVVTTEQLQKMGFISEKNLVGPDSFRTFKPGPSTLFNGNQTISDKCSDRFKDLESPPKKPGSFNVLNMSDINGGKRSGFLFPGSGDSTIKAASASGLKRKSECETGIEVSLSAMSLNQKECLVLKDLAVCGNTRKKSTWRTRVEDESTDDETTSLKRVKIKRIGPDGDEEIL